MQNIPFYKLIVVGCGASGMMFARLLMEYCEKLDPKDRDKLLSLGFLQIEAEDKVGKKILATGNGRCNILPTQIFKDCFFSNQKAKINDLLDSVPYNTIFDIFSNFGLSFFQEENRLYPRSLQAQSVIDVLDYNRQKYPGLSLRLEHKLKDVVYNEANKIYTLNIEDNEGKDLLLNCEFLVIAGGTIAGQAKGKSDFLEILKNLPLKFLPFRPALVPIELENPYRELSGLRLKAELTLLDGVFQKHHDFSHNSVVLLAETQEEGEILFTDYGLSGIVSMNLSRHILKDKKYTIKIDLFPEFDSETLLLKLKNISKISKNTNFLSGLLPKKLIKVLLFDFAENYSNYCPNLSKYICSQKHFFKNTGNLKNNSNSKKKNSSANKELEFTELVDPVLEKIKDELTSPNFVAYLKNFLLPIKEVRNFNYAQIAAGGIDFTSLKENSLESKNSPNLYFMGEVLDIDARCGGNNLYWAWLSAYLCFVALKEYFVSWLKD